MVSPMRWLAFDKLQRSCAGDLTDCPSMALQGVVHRDLKLENLLLDGSPQQRLKIADFGYSKVSFRHMCMQVHRAQTYGPVCAMQTAHVSQPCMCRWRLLTGAHDRMCLLQNMYASQPKSTVGTVAYIAPEVIFASSDLPFTAAFHYRF